MNILRRDANNFHLKDDMFARQWMITINHHFTDDNVGNDTGQLTVAILKREADRKNNNGS